jgi:hypothetical protein
MAPIALNSVAPWRRAESMKPLAEKRGRSTTLARAATEPSTEYAGALMWKRGSEVISRSSAVRPIHQGKPSPAIAYARCVWVTSFERPVVPEVGMRTAGSSGPAGPGPSRSPGCANRPGSSSSVTTSLGSTCPISPSSSAAVWLGLTAT